jgi:hypothetical protein
MRKLLVLMSIILVAQVAFSQCTLPAPPVIPAGQIRNVESTAAFGASVGEELFGTNEPVSWSIVSTQINGSEIDPLFQFNGATLTVLRDLEEIFTRAVVEVDLVVRAFNCMGVSNDASVLIRIIQTDQPAGRPVIHLGQVQIGTSAVAVGSVFGSSPISATNSPADWWIVSQDPALSLFDINTSGNLVVNVNLSNDPTVESVELMVQCANNNGVSDVALVQVFIAQVGAGTGSGDSFDYSSLIDDPALLECIRQEAGTTVLTAAVIQAIDRLDCSCRTGPAIFDLDGLQFLQNLEFLALSNNMITDITPITGLRSLTELRLSGNLIVDITTDNPFASLINLSFVDLSENDIAETYAFATLADLSWLSLAYNEVCDVQSLVDLADNGGLGNGDVLILDGNHLASQNGQQQIAVLQTAGVVVSDLDNDSVCPTTRDPLVMTSWPSKDVVDFTRALNTRGVCN